MKKLYIDVSTFCHRSALVTRAQSIPVGFLVLGSLCVSDTGDTVGIPCEGSQTEEALLTQSGDWLLSHSVVLREGSVL